MTPKALTARLQTLVSTRSSWDSLWRDIAKYVLPMRRDIGSWDTGPVPLGDLYDSTAILAQQNLASGLYGMISSPANQWFNLSLQGRSPTHEEQVWLEECAELMRTKLASNGNQFYASLLPFYLELTAFGTAVFYTYEKTDKKGSPTGDIFFACRPLPECYICENEYQEVDTVFRKYQLSARQARNRWGMDLPPPVTQALKSGNLDQKFTFVHGVIPKQDYEGFKGDHRFVSVHFYEGFDKILSVAGFHEMPYHVARWQKSTHGPYGDGVVGPVLPEIRMINAMAKTSLKAGQLAVDPPILASDEHGARGFRTHPGGINYNGVDHNGRPRYLPFNSGVNVPLSLEMEEQRRGQIKEAFYFTLLMMAQQKDMTATEVMTRQEEKMRLMAPHLGTIQSEFLDPLLNRLFSLMWRIGNFKAPPQGLEGGDINVDYVSPLARAQKITEAASIERTMASVAQMAQVNPGVLDNFDMDKMAVGVANAYGIPQSVIVGEDEVVKKRQAQQQAQQMQQLMEHAPQMADAMNKGAQAHKTGLEAQQMQADPQGQDPQGQDPQSNSQG